jgi:hypothetical protein
MQRITRPDWRVIMGAPEILMADEPGVWSHEKSRKDKSGGRWNFCYWYGGALAEKSRQGQRLFFWDDDKADCGVVLFSPEKTIPYSRISDLMGKLVAHQSERMKYQREFLFPLEQNYLGYGAFPEEEAK